MATDATAYETIDTEPTVVIGLVRDAGGLAGSDGLWLLSYSLQPWRLASGGVVRSPLNLWLTCRDERSLRGRLDRLPAPGSCARLRVRRAGHVDGLERPLSPFDVELVSLLDGDVLDPELLRVADDLDGTETERLPAEVDPPSPQRVLRRAHALCAIVTRAHLELEPSDFDCLDRLRRWLGAHPAVLEELEPPERAIVECPIGELEEQHVVDASWRAEGIAVLAWALGVAELPDHETLCDPEHLGPALGFFADQPPDDVDPPSLRPADELVWMGARLLGLHWRLRDFDLAPRALDFRQFAQSCWFGSFDLAGIPLADDDLSIGGRPIAEADAELVQKCASIALERHQAINWLLGFHSEYCEVDTST